MPTGAPQGVPVGNQSIPEVKITMMNHDFFLVRETVEEIIQKIAEYNAKVQDIHREITVTDRR